jgi:hypothetical protein
MKQLMMAGILTLLTTAFVSCGPPSEEVCKANLRMFKDAKAAWAQRNQKASNDVPTWNDLVGGGGYIRYVPDCPRKGIYTLGKVDELPKCSIEKHKL